MAKDTSLEISTKHKAFFYCYKLRSKTIMLSSWDCDHVHAFAGNTAALSRHGYNSFFLFDTTQSQKVFIRLNSWLTMALQELIQISSRPKVAFWNLTQIDPRLKKLPEFFDSNQLKTQETFQNFYSNRPMTQKLSWILIRMKSYLNDSNQCWFRWPFLGFSLNFVGLFWTFTQFH